MDDIIKNPVVRTVSLAVAAILVLIAAVFFVDMAVRSVGYGATVLDSIVERKAPEVLSGAEASARGAAVIGLTDGTTASAPRSVPLQAARNYPATQSPQPVVPRFSNAVMSYDAFGTYWHDSFVPRVSIDRREIPAMRTMVYNNGNAATNAWSFSCNWNGAVTTTQQAPLGAGERAFVVCDTQELPSGTHNVTLVYQEIGKPVQYQTVSVHVD